MRPGAVATKSLLRISIFIPAPLIALGVCTLLSVTVLDVAGITTVRNRYRAIPTNFFVFTAPALPAFSLGLLLDCLYYVVAIAFVSGVESLLCSSICRSRASAAFSSGARPTWSRWVKSARSRVITDASIQC